ncbi:hypothetical protein [Streptomyces sp. NPDC001020]
MLRCKGGIREWGALLGALTMMLALTVWGASSAAAGGPTSVLVVSPTSGEATGLYYSDKKYDELQQLLDRPATETGDNPPETNLAGTRQITVTWLVHDITPWRLDQVLDTGSDGVWIHTAANTPESTKGYWHRAADPTRLRTLLKKLGVMGRASDSGYAGLIPVPWQSSSAATPDAATGTTPPLVAASASGGTDWWWTIPGAVAGAVLALVLRSLVARAPGHLRRKHEPGPRQELRDV